MQFGLVCQNVFGTDCTNGSTYRHYFKWQMLSKNIFIKKKNKCLQNLNELKSYVKKVQTVILV